MLKLKSTESRNALFTKTISAQYVVEEALSILQCNKEYMCLVSSPSVKIKSWVTDEMQEASVNIAVLKHRPSVWKRKETSPKPKIINLIQFWLFFLLVEKKKKF